VIANQRGRIFDGLAAALAYHGYEDTKITDIVELAGLSRATFYEHFQGKEPCFAAAYEDGVERLAAAVEEAAQGERGGRISSPRGWAPDSNSLPPAHRLLTCFSLSHSLRRAPPGSSTRARWRGLPRPCAHRPPTGRRGRRSRGRPRGSLPAASPHTSRAWSWPEKSSACLNSTTFSSTTS
jgi:AcrR family transcriptional regulator